jgi:hypothetical protein
VANLVVRNAIYGALVGGQPNGAQALDVSVALQQLINAQGGVVTIDNASFGDPAPGNAKHFGALVNRDKQNLYFACKEGQQIDFNAAGTPTRTVPSNLHVEFAVYGALRGGNPLDAVAFDATNTLQAFFDDGDTEPVIFSGLFGSDVASGDVKHFAAAVTRDGTTYYYACEEGQYIDFATDGGS